MNLPWDDFASWEKGSGRCCRRRRRGNDPSSRPRPSRPLGKFSPRSATGSRVAAIPRRGRGVLRNRHAHRPQRRQGRAGRCGSARHERYERNDQPVRSLRKRRARIRRCWRRTVGAARTPDKVDRDGTRGCCSSCRRGFMRTCAERRPARRREKNRRLGATPDQRGERFLRCGRGKPIASSAL